MLSFMNDPIVNLSRKIRCVVSVKVRVINERSVTTYRVKIKVVRSPIHIVKSMREYLNIITKCFVHRSPDPLHGLLCKTFFFILIIKSRKKESVETHVGKESSICVGMSEWIDLPTNPRFNTKLFQSKLVTLHHIVNHIFIMGTGFIMHRPTCV